MRSLRWGVGVALLVLLVPLARVSSAATYTVPCTGNPSVDGTALQTLVASSTTSDTITLAGQCSYVITQTLTVTGRTLTLTTTGGQAVVQANGVRLMTVAANGRVNGDHLYLSSGDDRQASGGAGLAGNVVVDGILLLSDSVLAGGQGDQAGNLLVSGSATSNGHATLVRTSLVGGGATSATGASEAFAAGQLSLVDAVVRSVGARDAVRVEGPTASAEVFYDSFLGAGGVSLRASASTQVTGSVFDGPATACAGGGLAPVAPNLADDASCPGARVVPTTGIAGVSEPPYQPPSLVLDPGAAVIDAGDAAVCGHTTSAQGRYAGPTDTRGAARTYGPSCDLGAYESHARVQYDQAPAFTSALTRQTVVLRNTGTDGAHLDPHPTITGSAAFQVLSTTCGAALAPSASCSVEVAFAPAPTRQQAYLSMPDDAAGNGRAALVGLAAPAPAPAPTARPTSRPTTTPTRAPTARPVPTPSPSPTRSALSPAPVPAPRPTLTSPSPSGSPRPSLPSAAPTHRGSAWHERHTDSTLPWFARNVPAASEVDTDATAVGRNLLLALLLLALLNLPVNVVNRALDEHGDTLAGWAATLRRRLPRSLWLRHVPGPVRLAVAVTVTSVISSLLDPDAGLDRQTAITFAALLLGIGVISTVAASVEDTWCERRLRVSTRLELFPGFWLLSAVCVLVSRSVGLRPGLALGSVAGFAAVRALSCREDGTRVLVVTLALLGLGAYSWVAFGPLAHHAERTHAAAAEVLAAATGTVFVGVMGGTLLTMVPFGGLDGSLLRRWSRPAWAAVTFVALFGFVEVLLHDDGSDPLLQHPVYLAVLLGTYLLASGAFLGFWRWYDRSPRAEQLRARHAGVADG